MSGRRGSWISLKTEIGQTLLLCIATFLDEDTVRHLCGRMHDGRFWSPACESASRQGAVGLHYLDRVQHR